jgi:opacity protein-like surface antigen
MNDRTRAVAPCSRVVRKRPLLAAAIAGCLHASTAYAQTDYVDDWLRIADAVGPYASATLGYDSNTYRLDDDAPDIGDGRDDLLGTITLGFDSKLERAQQAWSFGAEVGHTWFADHDELDYTGGRAAAIWDWSTGGIATGELGYRYRRTLRDFANQFRADKVRDIRSEHQLLAGADFDVPGNWIVGVRGRWSDIAFSETPALDLQRSVYGADLRYVSGSGNVVALDAELLTADFDRGAEPDYDQYAVGPRIEWRLGGRTAIEAWVGYTRRDFSSSLRDDHDDVTGRATLEVGDRDGHAVEASLYRELTNFGDESAEFAVVDGVSLEPRWKLREGLDLRVRLAYEQRDFQVPAGAEDRSDDVLGGGVSVEWRVRRNLSLTLRADAERRDSTRTLQDYDFARVELQFTARM